MSDSHHDLLGKSALIAGEDNDHYAKLQQAVCDHIKPQNIFEQMIADDVINKKWEEVCLQRCAKGAIDVGFRNALKNHLRETGLNETESSQTARAFFAGTPKEKQRILARLAKHEFTIEDIYAAAMLTKLDQLRQIDQMRDTRESSRRRLQKDVKKLFKARQRAEAASSIVAERDTEASRDGD